MKTINRPIAGMTALLCAAGLMIAGTTGAQAAEPVDLTLLDGGNLVVNGDFSYPDFDCVDDHGLNWIYVYPDKGSAAGWAPVVQAEKVPGLSVESFGWTTDDLGAGQGFELHRETSGNVSALVHPGRLNGQLIDTIPGAVYTVRFRVAGRSASSGMGRMQVMVGPKGQEQPLTVTLVESSETGRAHGQTEGWAGTVIDAWSDGPDAGQDAGNPQWDHSHDWQTYEGVYTATTGETNYAWTNINETGGGVVIDDLSFEVSWPLTYELNGGQGILPNKEGE